MWKNHWTNKRIWKTSRNQINDHKYSWHRFYIEFLRLWVVLKVAKRAEFFQIILISINIWFWKFKFSSFFEVNGYETSYKIWMCYEKGDVKSIKNRKKQSIQMCWIATSWISWVHLNGICGWWSERVSLDCGKSNLHVDCINYYILYEMRANTEWCIVNSRCSYCWSFVSVMNKQRLII